MISYGICLSLSDFPQFNSIQLQTCPTLCDAIDCSMPGFPVLHHLAEFAQTRVHWAGDAIQPSHPLLSPSPPTFSLSQFQGLFKWVSSSHQVARDWSFSFNISPSNEYSGLISFRMDWVDLLAVQGTLKSLLQHHSSIFSHKAPQNYWKSIPPNSYRQEIWSQVELSFNSCSSIY